MEIKTKLQEIKEKVDSLLEHYSNDNGVIVDDDGRNIGVIFAITDKKQTGIIQNSGSNQFARMICSLIQNKSAKSLHTDTLFITAILQELGKFGEKTLLKFTEEAFKSIINKEKKDETV